MNKLYMNSDVDMKGIRIEKLKGRDHYVVPSYTLPFGVVMNDIYYPKEQILNTYKKLEGTLAPLGHPQNESGEYISAKDPMAINEYHIGAWNKTAKVDGNRIYVEKWIDIDQAKKHPQGAALIEAIESRQPMSTSVAVNLKRIPVTGKPYKYIAEILDFDHDSILKFGEKPAAGIEQGVGLNVNMMVVNVSDAQSIDINDESKQSLYNGFMEWLRGNKSNLNVNEEVEEMAELNEKQLGQIGEIVANALAKVEEEKKKEAEALQANADKEAYEKRIAELEAQLKDKPQTNADPDGDNRDDRVMREEVMKITGMSEEQVNKLDRDMLETIIGNQRRKDNRGDMNVNSANQGSDKKLTPQELLAQTYGE